MIFACFQSGGTEPVSIDCWKIKHKKGAIADTTSLRTPNGIKSEVKMEVWWFECASGLCNLSDNFQSKPTVTKLKTARQAKQ